MSQHGEPGYAEIGGAPRRADARVGAVDEQRGASWLRRVASSLAKHRRLPSAGYVQLATVDDACGDVPRPACRTVVFRGFRKSHGDAQTCDLVFCTDARSEKARGVSKPAEMCWCVACSSTRSSNA